MLPRAKGVSLERSHGIGGERNSQPSRGRRPLGQRIVEREKMEGPLDDNIPNTSISR